MSGGCKVGRVNDSKEVRYKLVEGGFPSYKRTRVHNNSKSEDF